VIGLAGAVIGGDAGNRFFVEPAEFGQR